ncbi:hypothetical protein [Luteimonas terrae]|uniref:DUF1109 domain-containing protein n=1 Tax=Luteimonas terrae TaxID=1530191 RepID=A0ABU1XZE6_9GAMM|nr:hypothetical protein [Luteimonas terrae]MDR7194063.1 hypothetical protein [Luteimonas terrae]
MSTWRSLWFGTEAPTPRHVGALVAVLTVCGLLLLGLFIDFIPPAVFRGRQAVILFGVIGLALTGLFYGALIRTGIRTGVWPSDWKLWLLAPAMPVFLGWIVWLVLAKAVPWAITRPFGSEHEMQAVMQTSHRASRRSCDYRLKGGPLAGTMPSFICISSRYYHRYPDRTVRVRLVGRSTVLGFAVISVHHVSSAEHLHAD